MLIRNAPIMETDVLIVGGGKEAPATAFNLSIPMPLFITTLLIQYTISKLFHIE